MKTLATNLVIVLTLASMAAFSNPKDGKENEAANAQYNVYHDQTHGSINLVYKTFSSHPVFVYIYNDQHRLVYADKIKESGVLIRPYNFRELEPGKYTFRIVEDKRVISSEVVYAPVTTSVLIQAELGQSSENKYRLSVTGNQMKPVKVKIFDKFNRLLFSETITGQAGFSKIYNLERMKGASCRFEVMVDDKNILEKTF